jgi:hypothetical protein
MENLGDVPEVFSGRQVPGGVRVVAEAAREASSLPELSRPPLPPRDLLRYR